MRPNDDNEDANTVCWETAPGGSFTCLPHDGRPAFDAPKAPPRSVASDPCYADFR